MMIPVMIMNNNDNIPSASGNICLITNEDNIHNTQRQNKNVINMYSYHTIKVSIISYSKFYYYF